MSIDSDYGDYQEYRETEQDCNLKGLEENYKKCKEDEERKKNPSFNRLRELGI